MTRAGWSSKETVVSVSASLILLGESCHRSQPLDEDTGVRERDRFHVTPVLDEALVQIHERGSILCLAVAEDPSGRLDCPVAGRIGCITKKQHAIHQIGRASRGMTGHRKHADGY